MSTKQMPLSDYMRHRFPSGCLFQEEAMRNFVAAGMQERKWLYEGERWLEQWVTDNAPTAHEQYIEAQILRYFDFKGVFR